MKTQLKTDNFEIAVTDITNDSISFVAKMSLAHLLTTEFGINDPTETTQHVNDYPTADNDNDITYYFTASSGNLNYNIKNSGSGYDYYDTHNEIVAIFGSQIVDFIDAHCKLLNIPFYPNR